MRRTLLLAALGLVALPASANAASLQVVFPQEAGVTVVQGQSTEFTLAVEAYGATSCGATTAPVVIETLYSVDAIGDIASGVPAEMPITTDDTRGESDNCDIRTPVLVPLTATAAADTPVGDYRGVIRYGKGGDGDVDTDGPPLNINVVAPPEAEPQALPEPALTPPEVLVLGERVAAKPHPTLGKTVMLTLVRGAVSFQMPGKAAMTLGSPMVVPNGTRIDATQGVVKVTVVRDRSGALDSADAWGTTFVASQGAGSRPLTTFTLKAAAASRKVGRAAARSKKRGAGLWVNGKGNFKTRGKRASAIVRGTYWYTAETSAGTKVSVKRGLVAVRDLVQKRDVLVSAGQSYTAKVRTTVSRRIPAFTGRAR